MNVRATFKPVLAKQILTTEVFSSKSQNEPNFQSVVGLNPNPDAHTWGYEPPLPSPDHSCCTAVLCFTWGAGMAASVHEYLVEVRPQPCGSHFYLLCRRIPRGLLYSQFVMPLSTFLTLTLSSPPPML